MLFLKYYLIQNLKTTLWHILIQVFSLILGPLVLAIILTKPWGTAVMSYVLTPLYAGFIYSYAWNVAKKDIKSYSVHKPYVCKGLMLSISTVLFTAIILLLWLTAFGLEPQSQTQVFLQFAKKAVFYGWTFTFNGFRAGANSNVNPLFWWLSFGLCPVSAFLGYLAGMYRLNITDRFIYPLVYQKSNPKKKD